MSWTDIPCGVPACDDGTGNPRLADILCTSLDGDVSKLGERGEGMTMALCCRHFWDWNAKSLQRRSNRQPECAEELVHVASRLQLLVDAGHLDQVKTARGPIAVDLRRLL